MHSYFYFENLLANFLNCTLSQGLTKILNDITDHKIKFSHITVKVYAGDSRVPVKNVMREYNSFIDTSKKYIYMQYIYYNYLTQGL